MPRRARIIIGAAVTVAIGLIVLAARIGGVTGHCPGQPKAIEAVTPACGSAALQLDTVSVDLAPGYEGQLEINGIAVPVQTVSALNLIEFKPGQGKEIEQLPADFNQARVTYWRSDLGPDQSNSFVWTFRVN
jgi:hypothetical protein